MFLFRKILFINVACFYCIFSYAQKNARPTVPVPNGFEVNSYTGNLYHARTELKIPGQGLNINITFSFNSSQRSKNWGFGNGWTFTYNILYLQDSLGIWIEREDGKRDLFRKNGTKYIAPVGIYDSLSEYQINKYLLATKDGLKYYFDDTSHKRLSKLQDRNGNTITLNYQNGKINELSDAVGHLLKFSWSDSLLTEIGDNTCTPYRKFKYEYDTSNNLIKAINPLEDYLLYHYDNSGRIIGFNDFNDYRMSFKYNQNGAVEKVVSCLTTHIFNYVNTQRTTFVTELVNDQKQITSYQFDTSGRIVNKKGNCCGYNIAYKYDTKNNILSTIDGVGSTTTYEYDQNGNVVKELLPDGFSLIYEYDQIFNKVSSFKDQNGNITTYEYDAFGNLIKIKKPLDITEKYTYDSKGNKLTFVDGNGNSSEYAYNSYGLLLKATDATGSTIQSTYDCHGNLLMRKDAIGNVTTHQYDALNRLGKTIDAYGNLIQYYYDKSSNLTSVINALGKETKYVYDGLNRKISSISPSDIKIITSYDEQGNLTKTTDGNKNSTTYTYNSRGQVLTETDALGFLTEYGYDEAGNRISIRDKNGGVTKMQYNKINRLAWTTDALNRTKSYNYDGTGNLISETDAESNITTYLFDALGRKKAIIDPYNNEIQFDYDKNGNKITEKDRNGNFTKYFYDKKNRLIKVINPVDSATLFMYDANDNLIEERKPFNQTISRTFDKLNRLTKIIEFPAGQTIYIYDKVSNIVQLKLYNGNVVTNTYDDDSRLIKVEDSLGIIAKYSYDNVSNKLSETDGVDHSSLFEYDALNRLIKHTDATGISAQIFYDKIGNITTQIDRNKNVTSATYDEMNQKISETDPLGNTSTFSYDKNGNLVKLIDANGNITSYNYDKLKRMQKQVYADGSFRKMIYDQNGNVVGKINATGQYTYRFNKLNQLVSRTYPNGAREEIIYDVLGRRLMAINSNSIVKFTYDQSDRILVETLNNKKTTYLYDQSLNTRTIAYPSGRNLVERRDKRDRLVSVSENSRSLVEFTYDNADRLIRKKLADSSVENYTYNKNNLVTKLTCTPELSVSLDISYDYEGNKMIVRNNIDSVQSKLFFYNNNYQLTSFYSGILDKNLKLGDTLRADTYNYDPVYNRTFSSDSTKTIYKANNLNQYETIEKDGGRYEIGYDKNENVTQTPGRKYFYDQNNRLIAIEDGERTEYSYDALGRRIQARKSNKIVNFYYDGMRLIESYDSSSSSVKSFVYGNWLDDLISMQNKGENYYFFNDKQGSIIAAVKSKKIVERYEYDAFGRIFYFDSTGQSRESSGISNEFGFCGRPLLNRKDLYDFRSRVYSADLAIFLQRDPLGYVDGANLYTAYFVPNSSDPLGMACLNYSLSSLEIKRISNLLSTIQSKLPFLSKFEIGGSGISFKGCLDEKCCNHEAKMLSEYSGAVDISMTLGYATKTGKYEAISYKVGAMAELSLSVKGPLNIKEKCSGYTGEGCIEGSVTGTLALGFEASSSEHFTIFGHEVGIDRKFGGRVGITVSAGIQVCIGNANSTGDFGVDFKFLTFSASAFASVDLGFGSFEGSFDLASLPNGLNFIFQ